MSPANAPWWAFDDNSPKDLAANAVPATGGMCPDCGNWTRGRLVGHIEAASGPGVAIVTHDNGRCPGKRP